MSSNWTKLFQKILKTFFITSHAAAKALVHSQTPRAHGGVGSQPPVPDRWSLVSWMVLRTHRKGWDRPDSPSWHHQQDPEAGTNRQTRNGQCVGQRLPGNLVVTTVCILPCPRAIVLISTHLLSSSKVFPTFSLQTPSLRDAATGRGCNSRQAHPTRTGQDGDAARRGRELYKEKRARVLALAGSSAAPLHPLVLPSS